MTKKKKVRRVVLGTGELSLLAEDNMGSRNALVGLWTGSVGDKDNPRRRMTLDKAQQFYGNREKVRLVLEVE